MDTKQINYFVTLARTLNFSEAALIHEITQPALTKAIQRLEKDLGGRLIHRHGKDTRLSGLGKTVLADFEALVLSEQKARDRADMVSSGHQEKIRLGIASTIIPLQFSHLIKTATKEIPNSRIILNTVEPSALTKLVLSGKLDCCFWSDFGEDNVKLSTLRLYNERLLLACAPGHRFASMEQIPVKELEQESYLDRLNCEFRQSARRILSDQGVTVKPILESAREDWIQQLVANNIGVCSLPEYSKLFPELVLRPIAGLNLSRNVHFISIYGATASEGAKKLEMILKDMHF